MWLDYSCHYSSRVTIPAGEHYIIWRAQHWLFLNVIAISKEETHVPDKREHLRHMSTNQSFQCQVGHLLFRVSG